MLHNTTQNSHKDGKLALFFQCPTDFPMTTCACEEDITRMQCWVYSYLSEQLEELEHSDALLERVNCWRAQRITLASQISDIAPVVGCLAVGGDIERAIPVAGYWVLLTLAFRLLDDLQDCEPMPQAQQPYALNYTAFSLQSIATMLLTRAAGSSSLAIIKACTMALIALCWAQSNEFPLRYRVPTKSDYFKQIVYKTANITATAFWSGGYVAYTDSPYLETLCSFGAATGIMAQIKDDCLDLYEDIRIGHYTLPVVCALSNKMNRQGVIQLKQLIAQNGVDGSVSDEIAAQVVQLGGVEVAQEVAENYKSYAIEALTQLPSGMAQKILKLYVSPSHIIA